MTFYRTNGLLVAHLQTVITAIFFWVSDQGSHFKDSVMEPMSKEHRINHTFTVAYSPRVNGTVENFKKHVCAACAALLTKLKLAEQIGRRPLP